MRLPGNEFDDQDEPLTLTPADLDGGAGAGDVPEPVPDLAWLATEPAPGREPSPPPSRRRGTMRRVPLRCWAALAAVAAVTVGVVAGAHGPHHPAGTQASAASAPTSTSTAGVGVCAGLSGAVVTEHGGDPATVPGVIATFEDAYYTQRNAEAAMRVVAPESGITQQSLAAGIATIPAGTLHCVAVTPITVNTANVHLVEVHPDRKRVDYLQVINTISGPSGGLLISHVQEQG
ncbi:hypothetical protein K7711_02760 [Nocardia sp. CA2R105]|uniref:hypothetical protein n=1 Tax=Nocardia coffeae TaxID=2873381 RepID=UPI001CA6977B|nr:hypothetical protein [Nocardia coffeae]MBY8855388.1 hypothetical protein [Nocardia coffeae]